MTCNLQHARTHARTFCTFSSCLLTLISAMPALRMRSVVSSHSRSNSCSCRAKKKQKIGGRQARGREQEVRELIAFAH